jgi:hypothetical protein
MILLLIGVGWLHILASILSAALFLFGLEIVALFTSFPQPAPAFEVDLVECKPSSLRASPLGLMLSDVYSICQRKTKMASSELLYFTERGWGRPSCLCVG